MECIPKAYVGMIKAGKLIFRAKVVTDDTSQQFTQIYESKQDRQDFPDANQHRKIQQSVENPIARKRIQSNPNTSIRIN